MQCLIGSFPVEEAFEVERDVGEADLCLGPLMRGGDDARIDDLPAHGQIAEALEMAVKPRKQGIDGISADQGFAEAPDRPLIGRVIAIVEPRETAKAAPVEDLEFRLRVRQDVECLQDQRLRAVFDQSGSYRHELK